MSIPFTQFMMPDGHQKQVSIERPAEISAKAFSLIEAGVRFEIEMLSTGEISMEAYHPGKDAVLASEIVQNGPGVPNAVDRLIENAFPAVVPELSYQS